MARIQFEEVSITVKRSIKDAETGKRRQQTKKFFQTLSPFNTTVDGRPKTREEINQQLYEQARQWANGADE